MHKGVGRSCPSTSGGSLVSRGGVSLLSELVSQTFGGFLALSAQTLEITVPRRVPECPLCLQGLSLGSMDHGRRPHSRRTQCGGCEPCPEACRLHLTPQP